MATHTRYKLSPSLQSLFHLHSNNSQTLSKLSNSVVRFQLLPNTWLNTNSLLLLQSSKPSSQYLKHQRPITATVAFSLPTAKPDRVASVENIPKWSRRAIKSFAMGELEARKLKYPTTGTEAILMGLLIEATSTTAKFLLANGITLFKVREESIKLLGKGDMYFFSPEHPPLTEDAQRALDWALDQKLKSTDGGEITTSHLLLGIWSEVESPGHKIMAGLGFNDAKADELKSLMSSPGNEG